MDTVAQLAGKYTFDQSYQGPLHSQAILDLQTIERNLVSQQRGIFGLFITIERSQSQRLDHYPFEIHGCLGDYSHPDPRGHVTPMPISRIMQQLRKLAYDTRFKDSRSNSFPKSLESDHKGVIKVTLMLFPLYRIRASDGRMVALPKEPTFNNKRWGIIYRGSGSSAPATYLPDVFPDLPWPKLRKSIVESKAGSTLTAGDRFWAYDTLIGETRVEQSLPNSSAQRGGARPGAISKSASSSVFQAKRVGSWYPHSFLKQIDHWEHQSSKQKSKPGRQGKGSRRIRGESCQTARGDKVVAILVPHAGFRYSGKTAFSAYNSVNWGPVRRIIIVSTSHSSDRIWLPAFDQVRVGHSVLFIDTADRDQLAQSPIFSVDSPNNSAFEGEHSWEVQLPFLAYFLPGGQAPRSSGPGTTILPILAGAEVTSRMSQVVDQILALPSLLSDLRHQKTILVINTDLTHYGPNYRYVLPNLKDKSIEQQVVEKDQRTLKRIIANNISQFRHHLDTVTVCGKYAVLLWMHLRQRLCRHHHLCLQSKQLCYSKSKTVIHSKDNSVRYASLIFYPKPSPRHHKGTKKRRHTWD